MSNETAALAEFAAGLTYEDIPEPVKQRAKDSIADTIATIVFGRDLPWSLMIIDYARRMASGGKSQILGDGSDPVAAPFAALANGALAHAFELDGAVRPSAGAHPGATILSAGLAMAQECGAGGKDLLTAFVAGTEVMLRIGYATKHSNETRGFHAPGTTGPFGAAVAGGKLFGFEAGQMTNALGIAGSLASGLVEFSRSGTGAMVKRLHFGRAAEGGVLASNLAASGFTGPNTVIEGDCGFLNVYCDETDPSWLTRELSNTWLTSRISMKRYACHSAGHTPVQAIVDLKRDHGLQASQVEAISIEVGEKELSRHNIRAPADVMLGQYSVPFCVALAVLDDATDPRTFRDADVTDPRIRALIDRIQLVPWAGGERPSSLATTTTVTLKDGNRLHTTVAGFKGTPDNPLSQQELRDKFLVLTGDRDESVMADLFERIQNIEDAASMDWVSV